MPSDMKERIAREFAELARTKSIDKITVKDIVEACHITRQTFYYHFQDLIDVIDWSLRQAMEELVEKSIRIDSREQVIELFLSEAVKARGPLLSGGGSASDRAFSEGGEPGKASVPFLRKRGDADSVSGAKGGSEAPELRGGYGKPDEIRGRAVW